MQMASTYVDPTSPVNPQQAPPVVNEAATSDGVYNYNTVPSAIRYSQLPQWGDANRETLQQDPKFKGYKCTTCANSKEECVCVSCSLCKAKVGKFTRHHCRRCWKAVCSKCRNRQRYLNPFAGMVERLKLPVCDTCAVYSALPKTNPSSEYVGLYLLRSVLDFPKQCVNSSPPSALASDVAGPKITGPAVCNTFTYADSCPVCSLPTVPAIQHEERLVRVVYCCSWANRCAKCASADLRMQAFEKHNELRRVQEFENCASRPDVVASILDSQIRAALPSLSMPVTHDVMMALISSSLCYEYASFPYTTLQLSDVPCASLLKLRECKQLYSIVEGPNKTLFVAIPGTHDFRTILADVKFQRIREYEQGQLHGGLQMAGGAGQYQVPLNEGIHTLWCYKVHSGFYMEHKKLLSAIPTAVLKDYVQKGYRLVFCGHSLGGALAMLTALRVLIDDLPTFQNAVTCVTFGAPLVGDSHFSDRIERSGWKSKFLNFVNRTDIVPRLLTERQLHVQALNSVKEKFTESVANPMKTIAGWFGGMKSSILGPKAKSDAKPEEPDLPAGPIAEAQGDEVDAADDDDDLVEEVVTPAPQAVQQQPVVVKVRRSFDGVGTYFFVGRPTPQDEGIAAIVDAATVSNRKALMIPAPTAAAPAAAPASRFPQWSFRPPSLPIPSAAPAPATTTSVAQEMHVSNCFVISNRHDAFETLKRKVPGASLDVGDHLLNSYNKALALIVAF